MKRSELTEAERACVFIYERMKNSRRDDASVTAANLLGKRLFESLEPEISPVFPVDAGYSITNYGAVSAHYNCSPNQSIESAKRGNTFATFELAEQEDLRRQAQTRVKEKINIANNGKNGFLLKEVNNFFMYYYYEAKEILIHCTSTTHSLSWWEYIRTDQAAETLRNDEEFVADWKLMKGIKV